MKIINYRGTKIELTAVRYIYGDEKTIQEGVFVHDTTDEFCDGDTIYGNGWTLGMINDEDDIESLLTSGDGSTYFAQNSDGTYHMRA